METTTNFTHISDAINAIAPETTITMKAFAIALEIPVTRLYSLAKKPVVGQVYDPAVTNWDAINEYIASKLAEEGSKFETMEAAVEAAVEVQKEMDERAVRHTATGSNLIDIDGGKMPKRKSNLMEQNEAGNTLLAFKKDAAVYQIVYQTAGYTVIREVNEDGSFAKEEVRVLSNVTMNTKIVPPTTLSQAIADRFSGAYQANSAPVEEAAEATSEEAAQ